MNLKNLITGAVVAIAVSATAGSALAAFPAWATGNVNVRSEPNTWYDNVVDVLYKGDKVWVEYCDYSWCELSDGYFVSAKYLTTEKYVKPKKKVKVYAPKKHYTKKHYDDSYGYVELGYGGVSIGFGSY